MQRTKPWDAVIIGGGVAGLSAAIYLARARRETLVVDAGKSLARCVPDVENYLGFPHGIAGEELLLRGHEQAMRYGAAFAEDAIEELRHAPRGVFQAVGKQEVYEARRVLLATGICHLPPDIPGVRDCLGQSMFFCKDCDGCRCEGKRIGILGWNNEAAEFALAMLLYSPCVFIFQNGHEPQWIARHEQWLREYEIPVYADKVIDVHHESGDVRWLELEFPPLDEQAIKRCLTRAFHGLTLAKEAQATHLKEEFAKHLAPEQLSWLDELMPASITWPDGRKLKLLYAEQARDEDGEPNPPELQVKIQECFALKEHPHICENKVPVKLWLATPDGKRLEATFNWPAFKTNSYPKLKPALQKKFPGTLWV